MSITVKAMTDDQLRELSQCIRQVIGDRTSHDAPGGQPIPFTTNIARPPNEAKRPNRNAYQRHQKVMVMAQNDNLRDGLSVLAGIASELYIKTNLRDYISIIKENPVTSFFSIGACIMAIPFIGAIWSAVLLYLTS